MPVIKVKGGDKVIKVKGKHKTRAKAESQYRAIKASKVRRAKGGRRGKS